MLLALTLTELVTPWIAHLVGAEIRIFYLGAQGILPAVALLFTIVVAIPVLIVSLIGLCAGFFTIHASAVGALNRNLSGDRGKANALYTLFYYVGGAAGIAIGGDLYTRFGWRGVLAVALAMSLLPLGVGVAQWKANE